MLTIFFLEKTANAEKYPNIGECNYYDGSIGACNVTFICVKNVRQTNFFEANKKTKCLNQNTYSQFISEGYSKSWIGMISYQNCELTQLQDNIFTIYTIVHTFNISDLNLPSLQPETFDGAKNLLILYASHNQITELPVNLFHHAINLSIVDFSFNRIKRIDSNAFSAENQVKMIDLSHNELCEMDIQSFQHLDKLEKMSLSHNEIEEIPSFLFHKTEKLVEIDFSFNKIRKIDSFAFSGDLNLKKLNLGHNLLEDLRKKFFENHVALTDLNFSNNQITILTPDVFENLTSLVNLNISGNYLTKLNSKTFASLEKLKILDLSKNLLKTLSVNDLPAEHRQLELLFIGNNQLNELSGFVSTSIGNAKIVGIDSNRFNCSYLNAFFKMIKWKNLDTISSRINCSPVEEEKRDNDSNRVETFLEKEESDGKINQTNKYFEGENWDSKADENFGNNNKKNQNDKKNRKIYENSGNTANHSILTWLNTIGLILMALALFWIVFRKKLLKNFADKPIYRENQTVTMSAIESDLENIVM